MRRALAALILVVCAAALAGCGGDDDPDGDASEPTTKTINITIEGDTLTPNGDRVTVQVDQPIELVVKADAAGEIHVHSEPEQQLEYAAGTNTLHLTIGKPGVVEVESHELGKVIVQLEVE